MLIVFVDDADNFSPQFGQSSYQYSIGAYSESGVSVGTVSASDADSGPFGNFVFNFSKPSLYFAVRGLKMFGRSLHDNVNFKVHKSISIYGFRPHIDYMVTHTTTK